MNGVAAKEFRVLVFQLAEKLSAADCESLRFIYGLPEGDRLAGRPGSGLEILKTLNRQGVYSDARGLGEVLRTAHREDLAMEAEDFRPFLDRGGTGAGLTTPCSLRGMCDANAARAGALAAELSVVSGRITDSGLPQEALGRIFGELEEMERAMKNLLERCEVVRRCCVDGQSLAAQGSDDVWKETSRLPPQSIPIPRWIGGHHSLERWTAGKHRWSHSATPPSQPLRCFSAHHVRSFSACDAIASCSQELPARARAESHCLEKRQSSHRMGKSSHLVSSSSSAASSPPPSAAAAGAISKTCSQEKPKLPKKPGIMPTVGDTLFLFLHVSWNSILCKM